MTNKETQNEVMFVYVFVSVTTKLEGTDELRMIVGWVGDESTSSELSYLIFDFVFLPAEKVLCAPFCRKS